MARPTTCLDRLASLALQKHQRHNRRASRIGALGKDPGELLQAIQVGTRCVRPADWLAVQRIPFPCGDDAAMLFSICFVVLVSVLLGLGLVLVMRNHQCTTYLPYSLCRSIGTSSPSSSVEIRGHRQTQRSVWLYYVCTMYLNATTGTKPRANHNA